MIRRPPRSTPSNSSAASDVYKRQTLNISKLKSELTTLKKDKKSLYSQILEIREEVEHAEKVKTCIEQLQEQEKQLSQVNRNELDL